MERPPASGHRWVDACAWAALALAVSGQWLLFAQYVRREVAWSYPVNYDQAHYLDVAYRTYERAREAGPLAALRLAHRLAAPTGSALHLEAALLFALRQPSRLTALGVSWMHLLLFQAALVAVLRARSRGWALSFLALGLSWSAATTFHSAGGIDDFRIDFAAWCLYGTFLAVVIHSDLFRRRGWALAAGAVATLCVITRTLTSVYLGGLLCLWIAGLLVRRRLARGDERRADLRRQLSGAALCAGCLVLAGVPALAVRARALWNYYVAGHVSGPVSAILADSTGLRDLWTFLWFYPANLVEFHLGWVFLTMAALALGALALLRSQGAAGDPHAAGFGELAFVTTAALVPLVVLTVDSAKSPVVAGIMVGPILWAVVLGAARLAPRAHPRVLGFVAGVAFLAGAVFQVHRLSGPANVALDTAARKETVRLHADMARLVREQGWTRPRMLTDRKRDYFFAFPVWTYEREHVLIDVDTPLEHMIWAPTRSQILDSLRTSRLVVLTTPTHQWGWRYPFDLKLEKHLPRLRRYCERELVEIGTYHVPEEIRLYARIPRSGPAAAAGGEKGPDLVDPGLARSTHR
jgi:hypothetical protein